jgi:hypothetical protein
MRNPPSQNKGATRWNTNRRRKLREVERLEAHKLQSVSDFHDAVRKSKRNLFQASDDVRRAAIVLRLPINLELSFLYLARHVERPDYTGRP